MSHTVFSFWLLPSVFLRGTCCSHLAIGTGLLILLFLKATGWHFHPFLSLPVLLLCIAQLETGLCIFTIDVYNVAGLINNLLIKDDSYIWGIKMIACFYFKITFLQYTLVLPLLPFTFSPYERTRCGLKVTFTSGRALVKKW